MVTYEKKKTCKKIQSQTEINGPYFYFTFLKTRGRHRIGKKNTKSPV